MATFAEAYRLRDEAAQEIAKNLGVRVGVVGIGFDQKGGRTIRMTLLSQPPEGTELPDNFQGVPLDLNVAVTHAQTLPGSAPKQGGSPKER